MRLTGSFLFALALCGIAPAAEEPKDPPAKADPPPKKEEKRLSAREPSAEWLSAVERLRSHPWPGEIKNAGISAHIADVYDVAPEEREKMAKLTAAFEADLLKKAAQFEEDLKALRADYEQKMLPGVPEARRENARKVLEVSHQQWITPHDREAKFMRDAAKRARDYREKRSVLGPEENAAEMEALKKWTRDERERIKQEEEAAVNAVKGLLSADEQARLERFNRNRIKN